MGRGGMDVCVRVLCVLSRAEHSSSGGLPCEVCPSVVEEPHRGGLDRPGLSSHVKKKKLRGAFKF